MGLEFDAFFWYVLMMLENMLFYLGWIVEIIFVLLWMLERWMEGMIWWKLDDLLRALLDDLGWILIWVAPEENSHSPGRHLSFLAIRWGSLSIKFEPQLA